MHQHRCFETLSPKRRRAWIMPATLLLLTACGQTSVPPEQLVAQAQQAYAEGDVRTAIIEIKNALQQDPSQAEARRLLGEYNLALGNAVEAEAELIRAQELGADPDQLRLPLLRAKLLQGKNDEVVAATEEVASEALQPVANAADAQIPQLLTLRARALLAEGQTDAARAPLRQALDLQPDNADALLSMAWIAWLQSNPTEARASLQIALASDPRFDRALELLGDLEREAEQLQEAEAAYSQALENTNQPFSPRLKRALTRILRKDYDGAENDIQALQKLANAHPSVSYLRGFMAFNQENYPDARIALEETLAREPDYIPALFYLGATQYALENWAQAESYLNRFISRQPESPEANRLLALIRLRSGNSEQAERALKAALASDPEDRASLAMVSNLYLSQGRADEALHHLRQVIALEPDSAATRAQLGYALLQEGQREEGFTELERAVEAAPGESARLEIAIIAERLRAQEFDEALKLVERLRDRDDINPALYYNLKGLAYASQGNIDAAEAVFREGLQTTPEAQADLASNLVAILARSGRLAEARELATESLGANPEHLGLLMNLARLSASSGDDQGTEDFLKRAVAAYPESLRPLGTLAELYLSSNRPEQAVAVLGEGQAVHGDSADWLQLMARAQLAADNPAAAADLLQQLQTQQPDSAQISFALGRALAEAGELADARAAFEAGLALEPERLDARLAIVQLLIAEGQSEQARAMIEPALEDHPDNTEVIRQAVLIATQQQRYTDASKLLERALELQPGDRGFTGALSQTQWRAGEQEAAITTMSEWLAQHPEDQPIRFLLASAQVTTEQNDAAIENFRTLLQAQPDNAVALNNLAWLLREQDTEAALGHAEKAVALAPEAAPMRDTLGMILLEKGDYAAAVRELREAVKLSDNAPTMRLHLAKALVAQGEIQPAKEQLQAILEQHPGFSERHEAKQLLDRL